MKKIFTLILSVVFVLVSSTAVFADQSSQGTTGSGIATSSQEDEMEQPEQPEQPDEMDEMEQPEQQEQPDETEIDVEKNAVISFDSKSGELSVTLPEEKALELKFRSFGEAGKKEGLVKEAEALKDSTDVKDFIRLSVISIMLGDQEKARQYADQALAADPGNQKALMLLAEIAYRDGNTEEAKLRLQEASKANPNAKTKSLLANIEEDEGNVDKAVTQLEEAVKMEPENEDLYRKLGDLYKKEGNNEIKVFVEGEKPAFDVKPVAENGRTLVPIRAIAESLKAEVTWDNATSTATIKKGDTVIELRPGFDEAKVNGRTVKLDVPAMAKDGRILIPLRFISENLEAKVTYDSTTKIITVTTP